MNIVEALKIAKEQGKKVRPVGEDWFVEFDKETNIHVKKWRDSDIGSTILSISKTLADWEVIKEKPSKQTQYKIDSMKFQIVRYCDENADYEDCYDCKIRRVCRAKPYQPIRMLLDDWSLKDIVEAYHVLKKAGEI